MLLSPLRYINPISGNRGGSAISYFANCYYIFDTNKDFVLNNQDITSYLSGSSNDVSINIIFKRNTTGSKMCLFGSADNSFAIYLTASNEIQLETYDTAVQKLATTTNTFTDTTNDYYLSVIYNGVTPANSKIIVNDTDETLAVNTLTSTIDGTSNDYYLGSKGSGDYFDGKIKQFSINQGTETTGEHTTWIENLVSPASIFSDIVKLLNISSDPAYDVPNATYAALDTVNPVVSDKIFKLNTTSEGLTVPSNTTMNNIVYDAFTVGIWIKFNALTSGTKNIFGKYTNASERSFALNSTTIDFRISVYSTLNRTVTGNTAPPLNEWVFVVFVVNKTNSKIYINAIDDTNTNTVTDFPQASAGDFKIGLTDGFATPDTDIAFIQVIDKGLNQTEVTEWYNSGNPISAENATFSDNLGWQFKAKDLAYDGVVWTYTDSVSGQTITSSNNTQMQNDVCYGGLNVATSRNLLVGDRECNGVANLGETVDVIFNNGQSNSVGSEAVANLQAEYNGYRGDIKIWDGTSYNIINSVNNNVCNPSVGGATFGIQYSLAYKFTANSGRKLFLDQYHIGGTSLAITGVDDWNTSSVGEYFDLSKAQFDLADIDKIGYNVNYVAEIWNQHENDCKVESYANAYETNLTNYITKRRLTYPDLKFVIVLVHTDLPIGTNPYKATVKAAQLSVAAAMDNVITINQDGCSSQVDDVHRDAAGYEELGRLIYEALKDN